MSANDTAKLAALEYSHVPVSKVWQKPEIDVVSVADVTFAKGSMVTESATTKNAS